MHYYSVAEARVMPGIKLVLSQGAPGPFGEAVKSMFHVKGIDYVPVAQDVGEPNDELFEWTGRRNAPVVVVEGMKPADRWLDIIMLAERLQPDPRLLPEDPEERLQVVGLCNEVAGEDGFGWSRRASFLGHDTSEATGRLRQDYDATPRSAAKAPSRIAAILRMLTNRLNAQKARGSAYLVGSGLTAADIYWATFSIGIQPFPQDVSPMPEGLRELYELKIPEIEAAKDDVLFEHRMMVFQRHLVLPQDF